MTQENSTVMSGVQKEKNMLLSELGRRIWENTFPLKFLNGRASSATA